MKLNFKTIFSAILVGLFLTVSCDSGIRTEVEQVQKAQDEANVNISALEAQIDALTKALDAYKNVVDPSLAALREDLTSQVETLTAADKSLSDKLEAAEALLAQKADQSDLEAAVADYTAKVNAAVKEFNGQIATLGSSLDELSTKLTELTGAMSELDTRLGQDILDVRTLALAAQSYAEEVEATVNTAITSLTNRVSALEEAMVTLKETTIPGIEARISATEATIAEQTAAIAELGQKQTTMESNIQAMKTELEANIDAVEELLVMLQAATLDKDSFNEFKEAYLSQLREDSEAFQQVKNDLATLMANYEATIPGLLENVAANAAEIAILKSRIQSLVFVPAYEDLKFGIPFSLMTDGKVAMPVAYNDPESFFDVIYRVYPNDLAEALAENAVDIFTFDIESNLQTRGLSLEPKLTIKAAAGDNESGKIIFTLYHENFYASMDADEITLRDYAVSLRVDDEEMGIHIGSEYTGTTVQPSPKVWVDDEHLYKVDAASASGLSVAYTDEADEFVTDHEYIDSAEITPYKDCFLAAYVAPENGEPSGPMTYEALRELGYNVPDAYVTIEDSDDDCSFLVHDEDLSEVEFATVGVDSTKALKLVKEHLISTPEATTHPHRMNLHYTFYNGIVNMYPAAPSASLGDKGKIEMDAIINLDKATLFFNVTYQMNWDYLLDKDADHNNIGSFTTNYTREDIVADVRLVRGEELVKLDGSDDAYGIVPSDFAGKTFTLKTGASVPAALKSYDYNVNTEATISDEGTTITLGNIAIDSWGAEKEENSGVKEGAYPVLGTYNLPFSKENNAEVDLLVKDRNRTPITLQLATFPVTLLGGESQSEGGEYDSTSDRYLIKSKNLSADVYNAYVSQGIIDPEKYTQKQAFSTAETSEFNDLNFVVISAIEDNDRFEPVVTNNTNGGTLYMQSRDVTTAAERLSSPALIRLAQNYDNDQKYLSEPDESKQVTRTFYSYIGQNVNLVWSVTAQSAAPYKYTTYGALEDEDGYYFNISPSTVWENPDQILKANTELELIKNSNIQVVTGTNGEGGISPANFAAKGLVPVFTFANMPHDGITIGNEQGFDSNVKYYGQADQVAVKSALYVRSADVDFFVPGSEVMYVNYSDKKIDSVFVHKFNPIAEPESQTLTGEAVIRDGATGTLPLTLLDINGNKIYKNGAAQSNTGKYVETIQTIFGDITFTLVSVDGAQPAAGWAVSSGATPDKVQLTVPAGTTDGVREVVVGVHSYWKDYTYTFRVRTGDANSGISGENPDYGNGGSGVWE
ncbi:MAG: hypothetical protein K6E44_07675 [Bacteroidales bacterium]|nr:hypothetical protein [Bacteroidales bacterium]